MPSKLIFTCLSCLLLSVLSSAQESRNLVINHSFENYEDCPTQHTEEKGASAVIPGWTTPSGTAPDYFNRCANQMVGVPNNFAGESEPQDGDAYMGAILSGSESFYREYIQGELSQPLQPGMQYCITYYYRLASYSKFAVDQLSLYFSEERVFDGKNKTNLKIQPTMNNKPGLFLDNIGEWERVCRVYVAKGGEKYFIIGNFKSYEQTNYVVTDKNVMNKRNKEYAYYFFDNVSIKPLLNCNECPCVLQDFKASFIDTTYTGGKDHLTGEVKNIKNDGYIKVGILAGTPPYTIKWNDGYEGFERSNLKAGTYIFTASDKYNCKQSDTVTFIQPEITVREEKEGLQSIEEGEAIVLKNIFFEFNKTELLPESFTELDKVVQFIKENNVKKIEISGHTDNTGSDTYNQKLSEGRAGAVVNYLIAKGIDTSRLIAVGYGETKPIETNLSEEGQAINRRVEFRLLKK